MTHVKKISSFNRKLEEFLTTTGCVDNCRKSTIERYFESLTITFFCDFTGKPRRVKADILPRVEAAALKFLVNVNIENESEETEDLLSRHVAEFFAGAWSDFGDGTPPKALDPGKTRAFFFVEENALFLRISD